MNNDIRNALLDLFSVCLEVNGAGQWNAHMNYSAHTEGVNVYVLPADNDYQAKGYEYTLWHEVWVSEEHGGKPEEVVANLKALSDRVSEFLLPAQEEAA